MYAYMGGDSEHEQLISLLRDWLGQKCAFCSTPGRHGVVLINQGRITVLHVCWGWLGQSRAAKTWTQRHEFLADMIEFEKVLNRRYNAA